MGPQVVLVLATLLSSRVSGSTLFHGHGDLRYHGPTAIPHILHDGHIADTHEVAAAKAEHFATVAKAKARGGYGHDYSGSHTAGNSADHGYSGYAVPFHGPIAVPHVLHNGFLADTHEVAAAKNAHIAAKDSHGYGSAYGYNHHYSHDDHGDLRYHGPIAIPHVLHDGHIADTHEVAAAKAEHFAAVSKAKAHGGHSAGHGYSGHAVPYHGPTAKPVVLHNGFLADTHEVAAAKEHHIHVLHYSHEKSIH